MAAEPWIAIVDDDRSVLKALMRLLRNRGFEAKGYTSPAEFLAALPNGLPLCLILDFQMPGMTGLELSQYLTRSGIDIPTIIISANADFKVRERCESAGIVAFLSKPLETALLLDAIGAASSG